MEKQMLFNEGKKCLITSLHIEEREKDYNIMKEFIDKLEGLSFSELEKIIQDLESVYDYFREEESKLLKKIIDEWINVNDSDIQDKYSYNSFLNNEVEKVIRNAYKLNIRPISLFAIDGSSGAKCRYCNSENINTHPLGTLDDIANNTQCYIEIINLKFDLETKNEEQKGINTFEYLTSDYIISDDNIPDDAYLNLAKSIFENVIFFNQD